jgi:PKD repeat protein
MTVGLFESCSIRINILKQIGISSIPEVEGLFVRKDIVKVYFAAAVMMLFLLPLPAQVIVGEQGSHGPAKPLTTGPRATSIYGTHPRLLVRDSDWSDGLSVANIKARCKAGTQWWTQCQRVLNVAPGGIREIPTYAMKYLLNGNSADADLVISLILAVDTNSHDYRLLSDVSLGYDWVYNYSGFSPVQKAQAADKIDKFAQSMRTWMANRDIWSNYMGYTDSIGLAGLAIYGDSINASAFIDCALTNQSNMFLAMQYTNGSWPESLSLLNIMRLPQFLEFLEAYRTATVPTVDFFADIRDNQGDWLRSLLYFQIYNNMPTGQVPRIGDSFSETLNNSYRRNLELLTTRLNDSAGAGYMQLLEGTSAAQPTYYEGYAFEYILWYEPTLPTDGLDKLPDAMWFGPGSLDYVVFRNGWKTNSTVVTFKSGDAFTNDQHLDQGSFTISTTHPLAIDSGAYSMHNSDHYMNYYSRTLAHNSITVTNNGEVFQDPSTATVLANDGGERVLWSYAGVVQPNSKTLNDYLAKKYKGAHYETGNITAFENWPDYDYVFGDYSDSFNNELYKVGGNKAKVQTTSRELTYLGSDWLVVVDHIYTTDMKFVTTFNMHSINQPSINGTNQGGDATGGTTFSGDTVTIDNAGDKLFSRTMFPIGAPITKRGGSGYEYIVAGTNRISGAPADPLAGSWRVEVKDLTYSTDHLFVHVMKIQNAGEGTNQMPYTSRIKESEVVGAYFDGMATIYSNSRLAYSWASINMTETGATKFYAFNSVPNKNYSIININKENGGFEVTTARSSPNGTMTFKVNLTGNNQVIIGAEAKGDPSITDLATDPVAPNEGQDIDFSVTVHDPTILKFDTKFTGGRVKFYEGDPALSGRLLGNATINVSAGSTQKVHFNTTLPWALATRLIYAQLDVSDVVGFTDTDLANNKIYLPVYVNALPIPVIKAVNTSYINTSIVFDGKSSRDAEGPIQEYRWDFGDGSVVAGSRVNHTFLTVGMFTVTLKVWDLAEVQNQTTLVVNVTEVPKMAPVPDFEFSVQGGTLDPTVLTNVTFTSTTLDPDNITQGLFWDFGDGMSDVGSTVVHKYRHYGKYNVTLTVFWNTTLNATVVKNLTVIDLAPTPKIGLSMNDTVKKFVIEFDALDTADPDDDYGSLEFHWDFGDGTKVDGDTPSHAYVKSGLFNVTLTVADPGGAQAKATAQVIVRNRQPKALLKASNTTLAWNETLKLDGSGSSDPDGDPINYTWDFGDNSTFDLNVNTSHRFTKEGYFTVKLTVKDNDNGLNVATITIHQLAKVIIEPPPKKPKKTDNTMLYLGLGILIALIAVIGVVAFMLTRKKQRPPVEKTKLETDLSAGIGGTNSDGPLAENEPEEPVPAPIKEIPKAKAVVAKPKDPKEEDLK